MILPLSYLALVLCIISIVIIAVQLLSESDVVKKHYGIPRILGMDGNILIKILRKHVFIYFIFPFAPAMIFGGILVFIFARTMFTLSFDIPVFLPIKTPIIHAVVITIGVFIIIYCIYALIAYIILKKEVLSKK